MGTFIVLLILIAVVFLAIRKIYKDKKSGKLALHAQAAVIADADIAMIL